METDIILEGFCKAERLHGVLYINYIGDSDSSVYPTLIQSVTGWEHANNISHLMEKGPFW